MLSLWKRILYVSTYIYYAFIYIYVSTCIYYAFIYFCVIVYHLCFELIWIDCVFLVEFTEDEKYQLMQLPQNDHIFSLSFVFLK